LASPSSRVLVEEHLENCEACRELEKSMHGEVKLPADTDVDPLKKISRKLLRRKVTAVGLTILGMSLLAMLTLIHLNSPITISYEQIADSVEVDVEEDGSVNITMDNPGNGVEFSNGYDENGAPQRYIRCYTSKWNQLVGRQGNRSTFQIKKSAEGEKEVSKVYYYPSIKDGSAVLLYESEKAVQNGSQGVAIMPRLTLNYYLLFGVMLTLVGIVFCCVLKKDRKKFRVALNLTMLPAVYAASSMAVLHGKGDIYDIEYYFSAILLITIVIYSIVCWGLAYLQYQKN